MAQDSDGVHQAIAEVLAAPPEEVMNTQVDILDVAEPTKQMKAEVRNSIILICDVVGNAKSS